MTPALILTALAAGLAVALFRAWRLVDQMTDLR